MKLFDLVYDTLLNQYGVVLGDIENFDGENLEIFKIRNSCNSPYVLYLKYNYFKVVKMQHFDYVNCMFKDKVQYFIWKYFYNYLLNLALNESVNENEFDYYDAAIAGIASMGIAGELAMSVSANGTGSYHIEIINGLSRLNEEIMGEMIKLG